MSRFSDPFALDLRHADKWPFDIFYESAIIRVGYSKIFHHILNESLKNADWKESDHTDLLLHLRTCTAQFQVTQLANFTPGLMSNSLCKKVTQARHIN